MWVFGWGVAGVEKVVTINDTCTPYPFIILERVKTEYEVNNVVSEKQTIIQFDDNTNLGRVIDQYYHEERDIIWCYSAISNNNDSFVIVKYQLNNSEEGETEVEIICSGDPHNYYGAFRLVEDTQLEFQTDNSHYIIDLKSGTFIKQEVYSSYDEVSFANNGSFLFTDDL